MNTRTKLGLGGLVLGLASLTATSAFADPLDHLGLPHPHVNVVVNPAPVYAPAPAPAYGYGYGGRGWGGGEEPWHNPGIYNQRVQGRLNEIQNTVNVRVSRGELPQQAQWRFNNVIRPQIQQQLNQASADGFINRDERENINGQVEQAQTWSQHFSPRAPVNQPGYGGGPRW